MSVGDETRSRSALFSWRRIFDQPVCHVYVARGLKVNFNSSDLREQLSDPVSCAIVSTSSAGIGLATPSQSSCRENAATATARNEFISSLLSHGPSLGLINDDKTCMNRWLCLVSQLGRTND